MAAASVSAAVGPHVPRRYSSTDGGTSSTGVDDAPLLLDAVGPAEAPVVAVDGVLQQALVRLLAVGEQACRS